jgi:hypothetical protein
MEATQQQTQTPTPAPAQPQTYLESLVAGYNASQGDLANWMSVFGAESEAYNQQKQQELNEWQKAYNAVLESSPYKANPEQEQNLRKAAALKTLIGAFGNIADATSLGLASGKGSKRPGGKYIPARNTVAQSVEKDLAAADNAHLKEQALEQQSQKSLHEQLANLYKLRPKTEKNTDILKFIEMANGNMNNRFNAINSYIKWQADNELKKEMNTANNNAKLKAAQEKASSDATKTNWVVYVDQHSGAAISLPKTYRNSASIMSMLQIMRKNGVLSNDEFTKLEELKNSMGDYAAQQELEAELGRLLQNHPEQVELIRKMLGVQGGTPNGYGRFDVPLTPGNNSSGGSGSSSSQTGQNPTTTQVWTTPGQTEHFSSK